MKKCKDDEILNPATNRCVKKSGAIGKSLLTKKCKDDQVLNPATNRCVKKNGALGRQILEEMQKTLKSKSAKITKNKPETEKLTLKNSKPQKKHVPIDEIEKLTLKNSKPQKKHVPIDEIEELTIDKSKPQKKHVPIDKPENKNKQLSLKKCKDGEILNPKTNRCVSITGKIGKQLIQNAKVTNNVEKDKDNVIALMRQELQTSKEKIIVKVEFVKSGLHSLIVAYPNRDIEEKPFDVYTSYVMHDILDRYKNVYKKFIESGYVLKEQTGFTYDEMLDFIKTNQVCKIVKKPKVNAKLSTKSPVLKCTNDTTLVMFEPLSSVPKENIIQFEDNYCFEVNEIAEYIIAAQSFVNPLTKNGLCKNDIEKLFQHKKLETENLKKLKSLKSANENKIKDIKVFYQKHPKLVEHLLQLLLLTGLQCTCDYTEDFKDSQTALGIVFETVDNKLDESTKKVLLELASPGVNLNLSYVASNYNTVCIHGIGYTLTEIALYNIFELGCQHVIPAKLVYHPPNSRMIIQVVNTYGTVPVLHVYYDKDESNKYFSRFFARVGELYITKDNIEYDYINHFGMNYFSPYKFVEDNVLPFMVEVLSTTSRQFNTKTNLKTIEKVAQMLNKL
jgi:hypothetical protein